MLKELLTAREYCIFTFISTSHALKAEKVLRQEDALFVMMPTPREISTSCGLSVKVNVQARDEIRNILESQQVAIEGLYQVERLDKGKNAIQVLS